MIRYIRHDDINFEKWDSCIDRAVNGIFYAYSWYLDMCAVEWDALVEDDYVSVMPLPWRKKAGIRYCFQPFFIQQLGLFSTRSISEESCIRFLEAIPADIMFGEFTLNTFNGLPEGYPSVSGRGVTYELDLITPYDRIRGNYSANIRRNINKAVKKGVFTVSTGRPEDIIQAFRQNRGRRNIPFGDNDYRVLKHIIYAGIHRGMVSLRCAYSGTNDFCAGIVFFKSHGKSVLLFSGATPLARENGAMSMLIDDYIRENSGSETVLDFEGSSDPNLARFYRGFGSIECVFLHIRINRMPFWAKPFLSSYLKIRKHLS